MTIKNSIKELKARGYRVSYRQRKDGGILIKSIDGHTYRGATGNRVARALLGQKLSEARKVQLARLNPYKVRYAKVEKVVKGQVQYYKTGKKKGQARTTIKKVKTILDKERTRPALEKKSRLPDALVRELKNVQNIWRKGYNKISAHESIKGTITLGNLRYTYETYGEQEAWERLRKAKRYATGFAYEENVQWFHDVLKDLSDKLSERGLDTEAIDVIIERLEDDEVIIGFQEEWLAPLHEAYYRVSKKSGAVEQYDIDNMVMEINKTLNW